MAASLIRVVSHGDRLSTCSIRTDTFQRVIELAEAAYADFPTLNSSDIEVVVYGGSRIKRIWGVEFCVPTASVLALGSYLVVEALECHL